MCLGIFFPDALGKNDKTSLVKAMFAPQSLFQVFDLHECSSEKKRIKHKKTSSF